MKFLSCIVAFLDFIQSAKCHAAHDFLLRHGEHLDVFEEVVAQLVVEFPFDVFPFCLTLFGESGT